MAQAAAFGWIVAVSLFLLLTALAVGIASPDRLRTLARIQDASRWIIQGLIVLAAVASLAAVIALLKKADGETAPMLAARIALAGGVVVLSWMLIHTCSPSITRTPSTATGQPPGRTMPAGFSSRAMNRSPISGTSSISRWCSG